MYDELPDQRYVLVTPARNEEAHIWKTIESVASQTVRPAKWVIVSNGSTDRTESVVAGFLPTFPWIELVRAPDGTPRSFAAKVRCFNLGYERVKALDYGFIGCLDADISFGSDYFNFLLKKFAELPDLGVAGTPFCEHGKPRYDYRFTNIEHVSGACQLFRRRCFEDIGGYAPIEIGGADWMAVTTARMRGWRTRTFLEMACTHHRDIGTAGRGALAARFHYGVKDYCFGTHPLWLLFRAAYQSSRRPLVIGGALLLAGYGWSWMRRVKKPISRELELFHRKEQMRRLRKIIARMLSPRRPPSP